VAWLIFFLYLLLFSWLITRIGFIKRSGLPARILICLFIIKIGAGIAYFQFNSQPQYKYRSDTWKFYESSLAETETLKKEPLTFFSDLFVSDYNSNGNLFSGDRSYWNDVKDAAMIKLMAVTNIFTFNNYYANIIFFNFLFFIGLIAFYRVMKSIYPVKGYSLAAAIFLIPSFLFWCSGIHKDGLIFSCIGLIMYCFYSLLNKRKAIISILAMLTCFTVIFFLRNYLVLVLLPSLFAGWLVYKYPKRKWIAQGLVFILGTALFFSARYIHPSLDFPAYIVNKQKQFNKLEGNSVVAANELRPTVGSFVTNLPSAIDMGFFRPHPGEKGLISLVAAVEMILFWLLILVCFFYRPKGTPPDPVVLSCIIFSILTLIIIGYTVHFSGAVVRYRSLILPLLLAPAVGSMLSNSYINKKYI
jgi:hypothetical protein